MAVWRQCMSNVNETRKEIETETRVFPIPRLNVSKLNEILDNSRMMRKRDNCAHVHYHTRTSKGSIRAFCDKCEKELY